MESNSQEPTAAPDDTTEDPAQDPRLGVWVEVDPELDPFEEKLSPRQAAFVREYCISPNATTAAIRAGYSAANAGPIGFSTLRIAKVKRAIDKMSAYLLAASNTKAEEILHEAKIIATSSIDHYVITDDGQISLAEGAPPNAMAAVKSLKKKTRFAKDGTLTYEVELQLWDKPGSLKLMGKHAGIKAFFDKIEVSGPNGGPIPITEIRNVIVDPAAPSESHGSDS